MDDNSKNQLIAEALNFLPPALQRVITDEQTYTQLDTLAARHDISPEIWDVVENEIMMALLNITDPTTLEQNITSQANVSPEVVAELLKETEEIIFGPIQDELQEEFGNSAPNVVNYTNLGTYPYTDLDETQTTRLAELDALPSETVRTNPALRQEYAALIKKKQKTAANLQRLTTHARTPAQGTPWRIIDVIS